MESTLFSLTGDMVGERIVSCSLWTYHGESVSMARGTILLATLFLTCLSGVFAERVIGVEKLFPSLCLFVSGVLVGVWLSKAFVSEDSDEETAERKAGRECL